MSQRSLDAHLGWTTFTHDKECKKPVTEVDWRTDEEMNSRHGGPAHACPNDSCDHSDWLTKLRVRMLCRTCGVVLILTGENRSYQGTSTAIIGYGSAPKKISGLWLYPGERMFRNPDEDVWDYLVADKNVDRLTEQDIVGSIGRGVSKRGAVIWSAAAHPEFRPSYRDRSSTPDCVFRSTTEETFKTPTAAAKWIAARLQEGPPTASDAS